MMNRLWTGRFAVRIPTKLKETFPSSKCPDQLWDQTRHLFKGYRGFFQGIKQSGSEDDHSPPSKAEVKLDCSYTSLPLCALMAWARTNVTPP
jgi:hypothetical protein